MEKTLWGAIERSQILLLQYWQNQHFDNELKIISNLWGTNNFSLILEDTYLVNSIS